MSQWVERYQLWDAMVGQCLVPVSAFVADFVAFGHHFLAEMAERVAAAQAYWFSTGYTQEYTWLQKEQERRVHAWNAFLH